MHRPPPRLQVIDRLIAQLRGAAQQLPSGYQLQAIAFEKDDDTNYHMQVRDES